MWLMPATESENSLWAAIHWHSWLSDPLELFFPLCSKCKGMNPLNLSRKSWPLPTPQQSTKVVSLKKLMLSKKKEVKVYCLASARLKDLAILTTRSCLPLQQLTTILGRFLLQGDHSRWKALEMKLMGCLRSIYLQCSLLSETNCSWTCN